MEANWLDTREKQNKERNKPIRCLKKCGPSHDKKKATLAHDKTKQKTKERKWPGLHFIQAEKKTNTPNMNLEANKRLTRRLRLDEVSVEWHQRSYFATSSKARCCNRWRKMLQQFSSQWQVTLQVVQLNDTTANGGCCNRWDNVLRTTRADVVTGETTCCNQHIRALRLLGRRGARGSWTMLILARISTQRSID